MNITLTKARREERKALGAHWWTPLTVVTTELQSTAVDLQEVLHDSA